MMLIITKQVNIPDIEEATERERGPRVGILLDTIQQKLIDKQNIDLEFSETRHCIVDIAI